MVEELFLEQYTIEEKVQSIYNLLSEYLARFYPVYPEGHLKLDEKIVCVLQINPKNNTNIHLELTTPDYCFAKSLSKIIQTFETENDLGKDDISITICLAGR